MAETIFSKILRGEIPCHKVYEDDNVLAFLDIGPLSPGHTLVIPKEAVATVDQLSDESAAAIGKHFASVGVRGGDHGASHAHHAGQIRRA